LTFCPSTFRLINDDDLVAVDKAAVTAGICFDAIFFVTCTMLFIAIGIVLFMVYCCLLSSLSNGREPYKRGALISSYFPIYKGYRHHHLLLLPNLLNQAASDDVGQYRRCWRGVWYYHYIVQQLY